MKIAYIFAYFGDGGAEENAILLAKQAKLAGGKPLFIIDSSLESAKQRIKNESFEIVHLPMKSSFNIFKVLGSAIKLKKIIKQEKIDIIHSHMLREQSISIGAKVLGCKFILIRTFHRFDQFNWKMKLLLSIYKVFTDAVISISETMTKYLNKNGLTTKIHLIKNGVAKISVNKHEKAIGFMGRLVKEKGILNFVQSNIDIFRDNKLIIAGDGPDFANIKYIAKSNKLKIELVGKITNKREFYKKISVLVLPSVTEVLPLVVLEAYSCGLPVVAFDLDSLKGLITKNNGTLIKSFDYEKMGQESLALLKNQKSYETVNVAKYNSDYSVEGMWQNTERLYEALLNG